VTAWKGIEKPDLVIYEMHIGTFTENGTFLSAIERIPELVELGITAIELLPVAQSPGKWNWGYDGVNLFAVRNTYGTPDEFRELIDACHGAGLAVLLDVVYNHLGPEGNYLSDFGRYYSQKHRTPWGEAFDFDGRNAIPVRRFIVENVLYWLREFHLDGLRLDAVHFMFDEGDYTILDEIRDRVLEFERNAGRKIHLIAEANIFDRNLVVGRNGDRESNRRPYCASWCDDIMHSIYSLGVSTGTMTHRHYSGAPDLAESLHHGFIYTGPTVTRVADQDDIRRELATNRDYLSSLIVALQTHDSVGNHPHGKRLHHLTSVEFQMAAAALIFLYPAIPMIFMGEEYAVDSKFAFFVDFEDPGLRKRVDRGRAAEYPQHRWNGAISPSDPRAFRQANCHDETLRDHRVFDWYRALLVIRRDLTRIGLLRPENLMVECDQDRNYFLLSYSDKRVAGDTAQIHVRLRHHDESDDPQSLECAVHGDVVLDSCHSSVKNESTVRLNTNHAIVTRRRVSGRA
jgi:malto-oligosyltrehalose trehalohydrolase